MEKSNRQGRTELMEACRRGDVETARLLIAKGASPNEKNHNGTTPLMYAKTAAIGNGDLNLLQLLLDQGADINARDVNGKTALQYLEAHFERVVSFMKANGAK